MNGIVACQWQAINKRGGLLDNIDGRRNENILIRLNVAGELAATVMEFDG